MSKEALERLHRDVAEDVEFSYTKMKEMKGNTYWLGRNITGAWLKAAIETELWKHYGVAGGVVDPTIADSSRPIES